ncbi:MAG TPA: SDR family NAD(P)-dependent oxidoreductase [Steroidobacteraceae bacterium]|nr:SDR family NAD(P)-dependent oxidoreductase [Steroidobacteraceae bacterium]
MRQAARRLSADFPRKRAVVTGAASGLGLAFAKQLAADGWTLGLMDRNIGELKAVRNSLAQADQSIYSYHVDIADAEGFGGAVERFAEAEHGIDLMVNNAGVAAGGEFLATPLEDWRWIVDINLLGVVHGCRAALPYMRTAQSGCIINIASAAAFACGAHTSAYSVTKAGVVALSECLMQEFAGEGLRVTVAMPGFFPTKLLDGSRGAPAVAATARRLMEASSVNADEVASIILDAAGRRRVHVIVPGEYRKLWRWKRWFPGHFVRNFPKFAARVRS